MKQHISLETLVKPQIGDPFGPALDKIHTAIKEECLKFTNKYDYEEYVDDGHMDQYYSAISKLVKDRLGIIVTITSDLHEGSACCYSLMMPRYDMPGLSRYVQDLIQRSNDFSLPLENSLKFIKEHNGEVGTIDYENAKIGGAFSKYKDNYINIDYHKFFYRYDYSPQEITAVLLHELGHIFTYFELSSKVDRSNYLITEIANSLKNKEPASKRKVYILELSKQKMIDKKTAEDLAKEERPLLVGAKLFTSIFKQCMYNVKSLNMADMTSEHLADDFSCKFGYSAYLSHTLNKFQGGPVREYTSRQNRKKGKNDIKVDLGNMNISKDNREKEKREPGMLGAILGTLFGGVLALLGVSIAMVVISFIVLLLVVMLPIIFIILVLAIGLAGTKELFDNVSSLVFWLIFGEFLGEHIYDTPYNRVERLIRTNIQILKTSNLPTAKKKLLIDQCMYIEDVLKNNQDLNTHDEFGWLHKLLTFLSSDAAKEADNMTIERNVERLVNNNLFLISARLDLYHKGK